eukprot:6474592-Amphidinium_carterae.1
MAQYFSLGGGVFATVEVHNSNEETFRNRCRARQQAPSAPGWVSGVSVISTIARNMRFRDCSKRNANNLINILSVCIL